VNGLGCSVHPKTKVTRVVSLMTRKGGESGKNTTRKGKQKHQGRKESVSDPQAVGYQTRRSEGIEDVKKGKKGK